MNNGNAIHGANQSKPETSKYREEPFPPKLKWWQWIFLVISVVFILFGLGYAGDQLCIKKSPSCLCCTYIAFGFVLAGLIIFRLVRHKLIVHKARLEDRSEIDSLLAEARVVVKSEKVDVDKKELLKKEKEHLEQLGEKGWTEYQILQLNQMLVEFLEKNKLIGRARLTLEELEEYAEDTSCRYEWEHFYRRQQRIERIIDKIEEDEGANNASENDAYVKELGAALWTLLEHVAGYEASWAKGSAIIRDIIMTGVMAIPILLVMGLLPVIYPELCNRALGIFNWGLLGITGSITAILWNLKKSNLVEVGSTEGKKELWRAVLSTVMGLVAGVLIYSMFAGGVLIAGTIVPKVDSGALNNTGLAVLWAIASGFCFENVFDRMVNATVGGN